MFSVKIEFEEEQDYNKEIEEYGKIISTDDISEAKGLYPLDQFGEYIAKIWLFKHILLLLLSNSCYFCKILRGNDGSWPRDVRQIYNFFWICPPLWCHISKKK